MAKATVLKCDVCDEWDSPDNKVQTVGIAGPRFDLCAIDRAAKIVEMGIPLDKAVEYVTKFDQRRSLRGAPPAIDGQDGADDGQEAAPDATAAVLTAIDAIVDEPTEVEETGVKPAGRRSAKR